MIKLYDEEVYREISPPPWAPEDKSACDLFYLRVRLFRADIKDGAFNTDTWTVYLLSEEHQTFEGEPNPTRGPKKNSITRTYTTGPDSERIRQAIDILDRFVAPEEAK
ncbi:hypothetical protein LCGC14_2113380 [marine sediment metagenome]|uniref:Uncharacterized protein n=1 Tax=marine sediment metagenome TaxID=412755 RepID=A0A0F9H2N8_9ZZZZ